jgi:hypothetical protein
MAYPKQQKSDPSSDSVDSGHFPEAGDMALDGALDGPTHSAIAERAHELWISQGCPPDSALHNWLEAEKELRADTTPPASK